MKAKARIERFNTQTFVRRILDDLRPHLGVHYSPLFEATRDPNVFRKAIADLTSESVEGRSTALVAALRQVEACVSKLPTWGGSTDDGRRDAARETFLRAERRCAIVNKRLRHYRAHPLRISKIVREVINMAQDRVFSVLGHPPDFSIFENCNFGPGLTYGLTHEERHLMFKVSANQTVTPSARQLAIEVITKCFPHWGDHLASEGYKLSVVAGNRIAFVPKNSGTYRTIGIEPSLNVWLQKAIDHYLKRLLRCNGLRLRDQDYSSDLIVRESGTVLGVATVDLKAASDSISYEVVRLLLPPEWFALLDVLRSKNYTLDKGVTWHRYHKFSSMGNATTFPLESLIFEAIAWGCVRYCGGDVGRIRVYGDDIIVPPEACALLYETCMFLGFRVNTDKSFAFGDFRETCGVDILRGVNIRPVYLRDVPRNPPMVANLFNRLLTNSYGFTFESTLGYLHSLVRRPLYGPAYFGWSSTERFDSRPWEEWYEGRNTLCDAYFFAPQGVLPRHQSKRYQTGKWHLERWFYSRPRLRGTFSERSLYLAFLLGMEKGVPLSNEGHLKVRTETFYGDWPDLDWWPELYDDVVGGPRLPVNTHIVESASGAILP